MEDKGRGKAKKGKAPRLAVVPSGNVVALVKGQGKDVNGLTSKQEAFCQGVAVRGETLTQAYRAAYDCQNMAPSTINEHACRLMASDKVRARVNALIEQKRAKTSHDTALNSIRIREKVRQRLETESEDMNNPGSVRLKALELLGKMTDVSLFVEKVETTTREEKTPEAIHEEIKQKLAKLAG